MQPLYAKVKTSIKRKILNDEYSIGEYIQTENELEKIYNVSKVTIRKAISELESEGYLKKYPAKGTVVVSKYPTSKLSKVSNFTHILKESGKELKKQNISYSKVSTKSLEILKEFDSRECTKIYREYVLEGEMYSQVIHYINGDIDLSNDLKNYQGSLYEMLFAQGIEIVRVLDKFSVVSEKLLRIRYSYDEEDQLIEISESLYDTQIQEYITLHSSK